MKQYFLSIKNFLKTAKEHVTPAAIKQFLSSPSYPRMAALLGILIIAIVLPVTVTVLQQQTNTQQHAAGSTCVGNGGTCISALRACPSGYQANSNLTNTCGIDGVGPNGDETCCTPKPPAGCTPTKYTSIPPVCSGGVLYNYTQDNCGVKHIVSSVTIGTPDCKAPSSCQDQTSTYTTCNGTTLTVWTHHTCKPDAQVTQTPNAPQCQPTPAPIDCKSIGGTCFGAPDVCPNGNIYGGASNCPASTPLCCQQKVVPPPPANPDCPNFTAGEFNSSGLIPGGSAACAPASNCFNTCSAFAVAAKAPSCQYPSDYTMTKVDEGNNTTRVDCTYNGPNTKTVIDPIATYTCDTADNSYVVHDPTTHTDFTASCSTSEVCDTSAASPTHAPCSPMPTPATNVLHCGSDNKGICYWWNGSQQHTVTTESSKACTGFDLGCRGTLPNCDDMEGPGSIPESGGKLCSDVSGFVTSSQCCSPSTANKAALLPTPVPNTKYCYGNDSNGKQQTGVCVWWANDNAHGGITVDESQACGSVLGCNGNLPACSSSQIAKIIGPLGSKSQQLSYNSGTECDSDIKVGNWFIQLSDAGVGVLTQPSAECCSLPQATSNTQVSTNASTYKDPVACMATDFCSILCNHLYSITSNQQTCLSACHDKVSSTFNSATQITLDSLKNSQGTICSTSCGSDSSCTSSCSQRFNTDAQNGLSMCTASNDIAQAGENGGGNGGGGTGGNNSCTNGIDTKVSLALALPGIDPNGDASVVNTTPAHLTHDNGDVRVTQKGSKQIAKEEQGHKFQHANGKFGQDNTTDIGTGLSCSNNYSVHVKIPMYGWSSADISYGSTNNGVTVNMIPGDATGDGIVNVNDYSVVEFCQDKDPNASQNATDNNGKPVTFTCGNVMNFLDFQDGGTSTTSLTGSGVSEWAANYNDYLRGLVTCSADSYCSSPNQ